MCVLERDMLPRIVALKVSLVRNVIDVITKLCAPMMGVNSEKKMNWQMP